MQEAMSTQKSKNASDNIDELQDRMYELEGILQQDVPKGYIRDVDFNRTTEKVVLEIEPPIKDDGPLYLSLNMPTVKQDEQILDVLEYHGLDSTTMTALEGSRIPLQYDGEEWRTNYPFEKDSTGWNKGIRSKLPGMPTLSRPHLPDPKEKSLNLSSEPIKKAYMFMLFWPIGAMDYISQLIFGRDTMNVWGMEAVMIIIGLANMLVVLGASLAVIGAVFFFGLSVLIPLI